MIRFISSLLIFALIPSGKLTAAPGYDQGRAELEWVMERLIKWLPGVWDSFPQVWFERNVRIPSNEEEHEHWHRTFTRIDAPQIGEVVFYGQININGREGAILGGSQVLYHAVIDEKLGAVNIFGQGPENPENFENLHERPDLWGQVQFREREALNCDWLWRRDGNQIFGVLQGNTPDKQSYGPGTCSFISKRTDAEFRADAEWVLTPEQLWVYDNNWSGGMLFLGRYDKTHIRLYKAKPYDCRIKSSKEEIHTAHDRGFKTQIVDKENNKLTMMLLRAEYPSSDGFGREDRLRIIITDPTTNEIIQIAETEALADHITLNHVSLTVHCQKTKVFKRMSLK